MATTTTSRLPFVLADASLLQTQCYIDGAWTSSSSGATFGVEDPGTGQEWARCADAGTVEVAAAVASSAAAFGQYRKTTPRQRAQWLMTWQRLMEEAREDLATLVVHETGKPRAEALGELAYACSFPWWFAGEAERVQGTVSQSATAGRRVLTLKQPIGVVAALVPWNLPVALLVRKASGALAAGCTMVAKPSPETPLSALAIALLASRAGFPPGVLNVVPAGPENTPAVAEQLCLDERIRKVTFTGSTRVGRIIEGLCARGLKKTTLELGGNCPLIVFDDADVDQAVGQLMALKWKHAGQVCVTANRVYVQRTVYDRFVAALVAAARDQLRVGHGSQPGVTLGPVTTARSLARVEALVQDALGHGAQTVLGSGKRWQEDSTTANTGSGYFMDPTILAHVTDDMEMSQDEVFGPLLGVAVFDSEDEITQRANNTSMGLAAYVFTKNNSGNSSAAEAPFGGLKDSGHGKESGKDVAIDEYLITKTGTLTVDGHY
ncbi:succinate-semialdehyde dehydrogenase [Grosmannia clavigera kw1407]|uniref:Succinate-semialdehyde dehydrogenase n=1 Tax=Grosmannia clavigera (strain kw1407 / UAMH 11150) TaxID=655863 RepID=F0XGF9_GROCL|nr:succinate-semialdehyde dehydrogenase [Grosmannia clavigera kw1407]EFX03283.1 succinate-semialdehyde dehydrogenase [Grosmannia clavigera kw1407]